MTDKKEILKIKIEIYRKRKNKMKDKKERLTRTAWAVFKYCGTKTVTLRMKKKYEKIDLKFISKETNKIRGQN